MAGKVKVRSIVNRGSVLVGRILLKKDDNFLLHVVHAYSERTMSVALLGGNIEHLQRPIAYYWKIMLSSSVSCCVAGMYYYLITHSFFGCSSSFTNAFCSSFPADSIPQELPRTLSVYEAAFHPIIFIIRSKDFIMASWSWILDLIAQ